MEGSKDKSKKPAAPKEEKPELEE
jgi:hypothetical protein